MIHQSIQQHLAKFLICRLKYFEEGQMSRVFPVCCSLLCFSIVAVNAHRGYKRCRLTGRVKVDVKAQSHSKLYNRAEESTWQSHWWDGEERETESARKRRKFRRAFVSVYPPHCTYNMLYMSCWWIGRNEVLAIKMTIFPPPILL